MNISSYIRKNTSIFVLSALLSVSFSFSQHAVSTVKNLNSPASPYGVCISSDGKTLYMTSYNGHNIRKIDLTNNVLSVIAGSGQSGFQNGSSSTSKFSYPTGIAVNSTNTKLYVADNNNSLIREIDLSTNQVTSFAGDGSFAFADGIGTAAKLNQPFDIKISGDTVLYFSDSENHCIRKISIATKQVTTLFGTGGTLGFQDGIGTNTLMNGPRGIAISPDGNTIYIAEIGYSIIRKADLTTNTLSHLAGDGTQGYVDNAIALQAKFYAPNGVAVDPINPSVLYITDTYNHRIRMMNTTTTEVSTLAGTGELSFADNTNGMLAKFNYPINVIVSPDGQNVYIADKENHRARQMKTDNPTGGVSELENKVEIYPTFIDNQFIVSSNKMEFNKIELVDINGKIVESYTFSSTGFYTVNNIKLNKGLYIVRVYAGSNLLIKSKIIK